MRHAGHSLHSTLARSMVGLLLWFAASVALGCPTPLAKRAAGPVVHGQRTTFRSLRWSSATDLHVSFVLQRVGVDLRWYHDAVEPVVIALWDDDASQARHIAKFIKHVVLSPAFRDQREDTAVLETVVQPPSAAEWIQAGMGTGPLHTVRVRLPPRPSP